MKLSKREVIHAMTCSVAEWHQMSNEKRIALIDLEIAKCKDQDAIISKKRKANDEIE